MANETTASTLSAYTRTEVMAQRAILANLPKFVFLGQFHRDSISGMNAPLKRYFKQGDLGAASAGTEGTALSSNTALSLGSSVTVTPTEGVAILSQVTENAASLALGIPFEQVQRMFVDGSSDAIASMIEPIINEHIPMAMQKMEADALALMSGLSTSVGSTTVDCSIANLMAAQYQFRLNQPLRGIQEAKYVLAEIQVNDVNTEAISTSGGVGGAIWGNQANYGLANAQDDLGAGYIGTFLGRPVHTYDAELNVTANASADVVGCFGVLGRPGVAPDAPEMMGRPGAFVYLEKAPLMTRAHANLLLRAVDVVTTAHYLCAELVDLNAVKIVTDAP
jgi:hypothetical protein